MTGSSRAASINTLDAQDGHPLWIEARFARPDYDLTFVRNDSGGIQDVEPGLVAVVLLAARRWCMVSHRC